MAVIRVKKNKNYTAMSNVHLRDKNLSLKAKGLLSLILSLPDDWSYSVNGLTANVKEGRDVVLSTLRELEQHGYVFREQSRDGKGRMGKIEYLIYEVPEENPLWVLQSKKPQSENPTTGKPTTAKPITEDPMSEDPQSETTLLLSTNKQNTDKTNNRMKKEIRHQYGGYQNVLFSDLEYEKLREEFPYDYERWIERLSEYMASTGKNYKNHLATIRSWSRREKATRKETQVVGYSHSAYYDYEEGDSL